MNKSRAFWSLLTIIVFIALHFKIGSILNFDISLSLLLIPLWVFLSFDVQLGNFNKKEIPLILLMIVLPFMSGDILYWNEFFKSYLQYIISYYLLIRIAFKSVTIKKNVLIKTLYRIQLLLSITVLIQYVGVIFLNIDLLYNIFGEHQLYYQLPVNPRMKAFYLEPSYLGLVVINIYWALLKLQTKRFINSNLILTLFILIMARSAFAFIAFALITFYEYYIVNKNKKFSFSYILLFFIIIPLLLITYSENLLQMLRLSELSFNPDSVTSGYMRVIQPFIIVKQMIINDGHWFGLPFGELDNYIKAFSIHGYSENSINNAFFGLIAHWGILALLFYLFILYFFFRTKNQLYKSFILLSFLNLNNSGAFLVIQFIFISFLLPIMVIKLINIKK